MKERYFKYALVGRWIVREMENGNIPELDGVLEPLLRDLDLMVPVEGGFSPQKHADPNGIYELGDTYFEARQPESSELDAYLLEALK